MESIWAVPVLVSVLILGTLSVVPSASAVTLNPGDIIITDQNTIGSGCAPSPGCGGLIKVDPTTGVQTAIASGGLFFNPFDVVMDANGDLIVAEPNGSGGCPNFGCGSIFRVDPSNGNQFLISSGVPFFDPSSILIDANGDYIVLDFNAFGFAGGLFNITSAGVRTTIVSGGIFQIPVGLAIESDGNFVITDLGNFPHTFDAVLRVTPSGVQSIVSAGGLITSPNGVAIDINGDIIVANSGGTNGILRINPSSGAQSTISSGGLFTTPVEVTIDANGDYLVTDTGRVIKVDRNTLVQSVLSSGQLFVTPTGIFVVPSPLFVSGGQATGQTEILGTCGLAFPDGNVVDYGPLLPNSISPEVTLNMTNSGSVTALLEIRGTDWNSTSTNTKVMNGNQTHFNQTSFQNTYASKALLNSTDGTADSSFVPSALVKLVLQLEAILLNPSFTGAATQTMDFTVSCE